MRPRPAKSDVELIRPLADFLATETAGGAILIGAAVVGALWANSPWNGSYQSLWHSQASLGLAGHTITLDLRHWINDLLMALFFFVVGLEINRELTTGRLNSWKAAAAPAFAALGGMIAPALLFLAVNPADTRHGWGIPVATDIGLAIAAVALVGPRIPAEARVFLLALAIVDDIGAIVVIAVVYSSGLQPWWLLGAAACVVVALLARRLHRRSSATLAIFGTGLWVCVHYSGIHPTIAGVVMGLLAPNGARWSPDVVDGDELADVSSLDHVLETVRQARGTVSIVEWLEHRLHPWTTFVVLPLFALANAGIEVSVHDLSNALRSRVVLGIVLGLVIGKPLGILAATALARRLGIAELPNGLTPRMLGGLAMLAGIGFTVSLFVTDLAFPTAAVSAEAKLAVVAASIVAAALGLGILVSDRNAEADDDRDPPDDRPRPARSPEFPARN